MKKFKKSLELNKQFVKNISSEELEILMSDFDKYETDVQLLQTAVSSSCNHENIKREDGLDECLDCGVRNY